MAVSQFRRTTQSDTKRKGGKGSRGNWREKITVPKEMPTPFIMQNFEYADPNPDPELVEYDAAGNPLPVKTAYFKFRKHKRKLVGQGGKERYYDTPCSAGWNPHAQQPCVGCAAMDRQDKTCTLSDQFNIGVIHLAVYHRVPVITQEKGMIMRGDGKGPVMEERECGGKSCNYCRALQNYPPVLEANEWWPNYQANQIETVFGGRRYLEVGSGHLGDLGALDKAISQQCGGVRQTKDAMGNLYYARCQNFLDVTGYSCSVCGTLLIDATQDPRDLQELEAVASKKYPCYKCQKPVWLKENDTCQVCGNPVVNGLFTGVVWLQRQGEQTQSHIALARFDAIEDFENNMPPQWKQLLGGKSLKDRIAELNQQYNFEELNKPQSLENQAKRLQYNLADLGIGQGGAQSQMSGYYGAPAQPQQPAYQNYPTQQPGVAPVYPPMQGAPGFGPGPTAPTPNPSYGQPQPQSGPPSFVPPNKPHFGN